MTELFAHEAGNGADTIVFLHGFGASHVVWRQIQQEIAQDRHTLAYDLPGHGRSVDFPDAGPAKIAAKTILADLSRRDIERFHVVGHSMGGAIAVLMGLFAGQQVASLTLLAPGGFGPEINARLLRSYAAAKDAGSLRSCLEAMHGWNSEVSDGEVESDLALRLDERYRETLVRIGDLITRDGRQGEIPRESMAGLAMPVSVVWGDLDNVLPVHQSRALPADFALHVLPGYGHMLPQEAPDLVIRILRRNLG